MTGSTFLLCILQVFILQVFILQVFILQVFIWKSVLLKSVYIQDYFACFFSLQRLYCRLFILCRLNIQDGGHGLKCCGLLVLLFDFYISVSVFILRFYDKS